MKIITFLLPAPLKTPAGGYKVVYEYANRLAASGFKVNIVYPYFLYDIRRRYISNCKVFLMSILRYIKDYLQKSVYANHWFQLDERVNEVPIILLHKLLVPKSDIYVATAVQTAISLNKFRSCNNKVYLIQDFENWSGITDDIVISTYKYNMKAVVISNWLYNIVSKYNSNCHFLPNGFDFNFFKTTVSPVDRNKYCVSMLYHTDNRKGCKYGFAALDIVKNKFPSLCVKLFGVADRPNSLPDWYDYYKKPDQDTFNRIYNESAIFIGTSVVEGWGLTVGEAMICSCAIVCTDNEGYKEMVTNNETALMSPIKDSQRLAENIIKLIEDDELRMRIAFRGNEHIKKFSWESSFNKLKDILD